MGGSAYVFLGIQEKLERRVAVKILKPFLIEEKNFAERFIKEAKIASKFIHPNIVTIHDVGKSGDCHYIIMEYVETSLKDRLSQHSPLPPQEAIYIIQSIAGALEYAHDRGVIHRDIKPANILIRSNGTPVIADFGLARAVDSTTRLTSSREVMGTIYYMSPEQCQGKNVDNTCDIYSLGVVLFEMLTGRVPYRSETHTGLLYKHIYDRVPLLPAGLNRYQSLLNKMMAKNKEKRFPDAKQVIYKIDKLAAKRNKGTGTKPEFKVPWSDIKKPPLSLPPNEKRSTKKTPQKKKNILKNLLIASIAAFLVVVALLIFNIIRPTGEKITSQRNNRTEVNRIPRIELQEGVIKFEPEGGKLFKGSTVALSIKEQLRSSKGDEIYADIYYTLDDSEPTKYNGIKYDNPIVIDKDLELKARLISRIGDYEGKVYSHVYRIQTPIIAVGGRIIFSKKGGEYKEQVKVLLSYNPLRLSNGKIVASDIYYTTDGSEPTKEVGKLYKKGEPIVLKEEGKHRIKARVISRDEKFKGRVYERTFTIESQIITVTQLDQLDQKTQDDIKKKTYRIVIEVEGISKIDNKGKIQIFISRDGKAKVVDVDFKVEPPGKIKEVKDALNNEIKRENFLPPTRDGKPAEGKIQIVFEKIATLKDKIAFLRVWKI